MRRRFIVLGAITVAAVVIGATALHAQRAGVRGHWPGRGPGFGQMQRGPGGPGFGGGWLGGGPAFGRAGGFGMRRPGAALRGLDRALDLTDAQEASIKEIHEATRKAAEPVGDALRDARKSLHEAVFAATPDQAAIATAAAKVNELQSQLGALQLKARTDTAAVLTAEQRAKMGKR